jgi:hypothetical protein
LYFFFQICKKQGWYKFGTRTRLFDKSDKEYGRAIDLFIEKHASGLEAVLKNKYKSTEAVVFCEMFGEESFAGWHNFEKPFELKIIDVGILRKGILIPDEFVSEFGHLDIAKVVYRGKFTQEYQKTVYDDKTLTEGVVVKGTLKGKNPTHSLWMAKIKTNHWFAELTKRCEESEAFKQILLDNQKEQNETK